VMCGCGVRLRCGNLARELRASWTNFNLVLPDFTHLRDTDFEKHYHENIVGNIWNNEDAGPHQNCRSEEFGLV